MQNKYSPNHARSVHAKHFTGSFIISPLIDHMIGSFHIFSLSGRCSAERWSNSSVGRDLAHHPDGQPKSGNAASGIKRKKI